MPQIYIPCGLFVTHFTFLKVLISELVEAVDVLWLQCHTYNCTEGL